MPALTHQDVFNLMKELNATFQPPGECVATPKKMRGLLDRLQEYTDAVQAARRKYQILAVASGPVGAELLGGYDVSVPQWRRDMSNWQYRLAEYYRQLDEVPSAEEDTPTGCKLIYPTVTAPLLDGIWYQMMPGVVLNDEEKGRILSGEGHPDEDIAYRIPAEGDHPPGHSNRKPPDAVTPFSLGNQIKVYQDFQKENLERLINDLVNPPLLRPSEWPWWVTGLAILGGGVAIGVAGLYVYNLLPKPRQNPRPRSSVTGRLRKIAKNHLPEGWKKRSNTQRLGLMKELEDKAAKIERNGEGDSEAEGLRAAATIVRESLPSTEIAA